MAMIDTAHKAPFGAITVHRATAWFYGVGQSYSTRRARQQTEAEFLALKRSQLAHAGIALVDIVHDEPTVLSRVFDWIKDRRDTARTARMLQGLSSRQLEDIGLTRADVADYRGQGWTL